MKDLPKLTRPSAIERRGHYNDPNGEVQTAAPRDALWPSAVVLGVKTGAWAATAAAQVQALALDTHGKPIKGQRVDVRGRVAQSSRTRKRMVGGFYAYDNRPR